MPFDRFALLQRIMRRLRTSHFVRNVFMVGGGIAAAQAITLLSMPLLTRLYGPEAFGISAAFIAIIGIITPLSTMGYANAIVMPDNDAEAAAIARLSILCALILTPISLIIVYFSQSWLASWTGMEKHPNILYLIPVALLITAFLSVAEQSAIRELLFKQKAFAYIGSKVIEYILKLVGGFLGPSGLLIIILTLTGRLVNLVMQIFCVPRSSLLRLTSWFGFEGICDAAKSHKDFAKYWMPQRVIKTASVGLPTILLATLFGPAAAGQYSIVLLALGAPAMLLGKSVGEVFFPKITRAIKAKKPNSYNLLLKISLILFLFGAIPFGIVILWGSTLFPFVFGAEWKVAGNYSKWIAIWLLFNLVADASIVALPALNLQKSLLFREAIFLGLSIITLYIGFSVYNSDIVAVALFSVAGVLMNIYILYVTFKNLYINSKVW